MALLDEVCLRFAADPDTVALLARFSGPVGAGLGLDLVICQIVQRLAESVARLQVQGLPGNRATTTVLAEGQMALIFDAAVSAQSPAKRQQRCPGAGRGPAASDGRSLAVARKPRVKAGP